MDDLVQKPLGSSLSMLRLFVHLLILEKIELLSINVFFKICLKTLNMASIMILFIKS